MSTETPLFDELEEKWNAVGTDRRICDKYMRCFLIETGAEWLEDDEGNEVFPEPTLTDLNEGVDLTAYLVPRDVKVGDLVYNVEIIRHEPLPPKRKFKLFGRNQDSQGVL